MESPAQKSFMPSHLEPSSTKKDLSSFMTNPFRSERLIYRAIEADDEVVFGAVWQDPIAFRQTAAFPLIPQSSRDVQATMKRMVEQSMVAAVICVDVYEYNTRAHRLYQKLGFVEERVSREAVWQHNRWWDAITLSLLDREWREMQSSSAA